MGKTIFPVFVTSSSEPLQKGKDSFVVFKPPVKCHKVSFEFLNFANIFSFWLEVNKLFITILKEQHIFIS